MQSNNTDQTTPRLIPNSYGPFRALLHGYGAIRQGPGVDFPCEFEIGQSPTAHIFLGCRISDHVGLSYLAQPVSLDGFTDAGFRVFSSGPIHTVRLHGLEDDSNFDVGATYRLTSASQQAHGTFNTARAEFAITNFQIHNADIGPTREMITIDAPSLPWVGKTTIRACPEYSEIMNRVRAIRGVDITCNVEVDIDGHASTAEVAQYVDDLCYILSVGRGTKIQWVSGRFYDGSGLCFIEQYEARPTRQYLPIPVISVDAGTVATTKKFVEQALPVYLAREVPFRLSSGLIDAYLDSRQDIDYLEARGVKTVVVLEMLKDIVFNLANPPIKDSLMPEKKFTKIRKRSEIKNLLRALESEIRTAMQEVGESEKVVDEAVKEVSGKLGEMNRRTFQTVIAKVLDMLDVSCSEEDIIAMKNSRNSLVHKGEFYSSRLPPIKRQNHPAYKSVQHEYFFLLNLLDRIFLKLLGYGDRYINRRMPEEPEDAARV
jgi:hypothetical protein